MTYSKSRARKTRRGMSATQKIILSALGLVATCLLIFVGSIGYQYFQMYMNAPLGPALNLPTLAPSIPPALVTFSPAPEAGSVSTAASTPTIYWLPTITPFPNATPLPGFTQQTSVSTSTCGNESTMTILAIGTDARSDSYNYGLADVIRVVRVDFAARKVSILEFPRDLWVEIPEIADNINGQDHEKLNQAYLYGNPGFGYWDDPSAGPGLLARTMQINFGVTPDHYIAVNMRTFEKIVNAVGGIDIYLPNSVDGRTSDDMRSSLYFKPGNHHLNGTQALQMARIRLDGVFDRANTQNRVLCALRDKLTSPAVVKDIPAIINSFTDNVQTDMTPTQLGQLACLGTQIDPSLILFATFPQELFKSTRIYDPVFKFNVFVWDVDFDILRGYVTMFNLGSWPALAPAGDENEDSTPFCPPPGQ